MRQYWLPSTFLLSSQVQCYSFFPLLIFRRVLFFIIFFRFFSNPGPNAPVERRLSRRSPKSPKYIFYSAADRARALFTYNLAQLECLVYLHFYSSFFFSFLSFFFFKLAWYLSACLYLPLTIRFACERSTVRRPKLPPPTPGTARCVWKLALWGDVRSFGPLLKVTSTKERANWARLQVAWRGERNWKKVKRKTKTIKKKEIERKFAPRTFGGEQTCVWVAQLYPCAA